MILNPFLLSLIMLSLASVLYAQLFNPSFEEVQEKQKRIETLDAILLQGEGLIARKDSLQQQYNAIPTSQLGILDDAISEYNVTNIILFFLELNQLIRQSPIPSDTGYSIGEEILADETVLLPIRFSLAEINYSSLLSFLDNLERWNRAVRIQDLRIEQPLSNPGNSDRVRADIQLEALFFQTLPAQVSI